MERRKFLKSALAGFAVACPTCLAISTASASGSGGAAAPSEHPSWGYEGEGGPEGWGRLEPGFRVCDLGTGQSPIDLTQPTTASLNSIDLSWRSAPVQVVNNGHTIQVNCETGSEMVLDGRRFGLAQFHFHHPSEHAVDGQRHEMEVHFVHAADNGALGVLGVFVEAGAENSTLAPIWSAMPRSQGGEARVSQNINPAGLLPRDRRFYRYFGSLTTPPCSERVIWSVFGRPITASRRQIDQFADLFPMNARPLQNQNRRQLLSGS